MVLTDYGDSFIINPELRAGKLQKQLDEAKDRYSKLFPKK